MSRALIVSEAEFLTVLAAINLWRMVDKSTLPKALMMGDSGIPLLDEAGIDYLVARLCTPLPEDEPNPLPIKVTAPRRKGQ